MSERISGRAAGTVTRRLRNVKHSRIAQTNMNQMKLRLVLIAICVASFVIGCGKSDSGLGTVGEKPLDQSLVANDPALAMVERFNMGANLERMAAQVSKSTHTFGVVAAKHGVTNAASVVDREVHKLVPNFQPRWNRNLANAYSAQLPQNELRSLAVDGNKSPYAHRLKEVQNSVGEEMKKNSMPILTELVTEALSNAIK